MLYHRTIGFPEIAKKIKKSVTFTPDYSPHAKREAHNDRYGFIALPEMVTMKRDNIFEIETDDTGKLVKFCFRVEYNQDFDLCFAMLLKGCLVKTIWLNARNDKHHTLDTSRYDKP